MVIFVIENENLIMYGENLFPFKMKNLQWRVKLNPCEGMSFYRSEKKLYHRGTTAIIMN